MNRAGTDRTKPSGLPPRLRKRSIASGFWATRLGLSSAIALFSLSSLPQAAQAHTVRVTLSLSRSVGESYETFLQRAEAFAGVGVQRTFLTDILATEAIITLVSENFGVSVPLMDVQVTRQQWQQNPSAPDWAEYYDGAPNALDLLER